MNIDLYCYECGEKLIYSCIPLTSDGIINVKVKKHDCKNVWEDIIIKHYKNDDNVKVFYSDEKSIIGRVTHVEPKHFLMNRSTKLYFNQVTEILPFPKCKKSDIDQFTKKVRITYIMSNGLVCVVEGIVSQCNGDEITVSRSNDHCLIIKYDGIISIEEVPNEVINKTDEGLTLKQVEYKIMQGKAKSAYRWRKDKQQTQVRLDREDIVAVDWVTF